MSAAYLRHTWFVCAARVMTRILIDASGQTRVYYNEGGRPMQDSALVRDPKFQDRVVAETRTLLATVPNEVLEEC